MNKNTSRHLGWLAGAVALASLAGGAAYAGTSLLSISATDAVVQAAANTNLSTTGGVKSPIVSVQLPAGKFVLSAYGDLVNFGPSDYTRCQIVVNGVQIASVATIVGGQTTGTQGPAGYLSPFSLAGGVKVGAAGATATLQCWHDSSNGATPYVDGGATVVSHKTSSLQLAIQ